MDFSDQRRARHLEKILKLPYIRGLVSYPNGEIES